jgi:hypothetical protein
MKTLLLALCLCLSLAVSTVASAQQEQAEAEAPVGPDVEKLPFTPESIRMVVTFHQPKIQACYEEMLAGRAKPIEGTLMTAWTVTPEGLVKNARVLKKGTTVRDPKLNDCVVAVLTSMDFPKPKQAQPIEYPFNLKAIK